MQRQFKELDSSERDEQGYIRPDWLEDKPEWVQQTHRFLYSFYFLPKRRAFDRWNSVERLIALTTVFPVLFALLIALTFGLVLPIALGIVLPAFLLSRKITDIVGDYKPTWFYVLTGIGLFLLGAPIILAAGMLLGALLLVAALPILAGVWLYEMIKATADLILAPARAINLEMAQWGFFAKLTVTFALTLFLAAAVFSLILLSQGLGLLAIPALTPLITGFTGLFLFTPPVILTSAFWVGIGLSVVTAVLTVPALLYSLKNTIQHAWRSITGQKAIDAIEDLNAILPESPKEDPSAQPPRKETEHDPSLGHSHDPFASASNTRGQNGHGAGASAQISLTIAGGVYS